MLSSAAAGARQRQWWKAGDEPLYYLVSPRDVVLGRPRTADDHLLWLMQRGDFEEALEVCEAAESAGQLKSTEGSASVLDDIAAKYLDRLLSNGEATKAGL